MFAIFNKIHYLSFFVAYVNSVGPVVKISQGSLIGQYLESTKARLFSAFTAIPYAEPPIGDLRFKRALPGEPWDGILDASQSHAICPQSNIMFGDLNVTGDEDCLYLNVYTPQLTFLSSKLFPVMIFFYGGGFTSGNANRELYDPSNFLDEDIVLVIPNYRIGPLGFLTTNDEIVPGNNGLKDQNLAINWVKENIIWFGGDPNSITLFGQSAGGASAHFHMLSPMSRDLIKGVISESGTAVAPWAVAPNDQGLRNSRKLAQSVNCTINSSIEMVECLRKVDAYEIIRQQDNLYEWNVDPVTPFKPVIESNIKDAFLPEHPREIIKSGKAAKIPFITGVNTEEGALKSADIFGKPNLLKEFNEDFNRLAPLTLIYEETAPDKDDVTSKIRKFYFDGREIDNSTQVEATEMFSDGIFLSSANDAVWLHLKYTKQPVYYYTFGYRGTVSYSAAYGDFLTDYGVAHGDEILYLFSAQSFFSDYDPNDDEQEISDILITLWTNFAETGNPNPLPDSVTPAKWKPVQTENLEYYFIKNVSYITMADKLYWERAMFWKSLPVGYK